MIMHDSVSLRKILVLLVTALLLSCWWWGVVQAETDDLNISSFVYHRFGEDENPSTNIDLATFEQHLEYLRDNEVMVITLGEAVKLIREHGTLTGKTVVLTVDDGYESFLQNGMPLLRKYGFRATLFVNTANVGKSGYIDWEELRKLHEEGIEIGNHSHTHAYFVDVKAYERASFLRTDLQTSQRIFLHELGFMPNLFSYPYGEYTDEMAEVVEQEGFVAAAAQNSGVISTFSNLYALPRFPMGGSYTTLEGFAEKSAMLALPANVIDSPSHLVTESNSPVLRLQLQSPERLQTGQMQCFIADGRECSLHYDRDNGVVEIRSNGPLSARRTLYTITVPSAVKPGKWHWFSHLWILSGLK